MKREDKYMERDNKSIENECNENAVLLMEMYRDN